MTNGKHGEVKPTTTKPVAVEKAAKPVDPQALPTKVVCSKCGAIRGVRHIVYAKRVAKLGAERGIQNIPVPTEENLNEVKNNQNFIKARQANDASYLCRVCKKVKLDIEKKAKAAEKAKTKTA